MRASRLRKKSKMCFVASPTYLCDSAQASERLLARGLTPQAKLFREKHLASRIPNSVWPSSIASRQRRSAFL